MRTSYPGIKIDETRLLRLLEVLLAQRDGPCYAHCLTAEGSQAALLFLFFHKRLCGPLASSRFHHRPDPTHQPNTKLKAAYRKADKVIQDIVDLLAAA